MIYANSTALQVNLRNHPKRSVEGNESRVALEKETSAREV